MSVKVTLDSVLNPFVICTNIGVNSLTELYLSCLNPAWDSLRKQASASTFHYNVKVTSYNIATACLGFGVIKTLFNGGSIRLSIVSIPLLLFIRVVLERSLSVQSGTKTLLKGAIKTINPFKDGGSLEEASVIGNGFTSICVLASKAQSLANNRSWREDMFVIQGYAVLKNWA